MADIPDPVLVAFGAAVRARRIELGLSQEALARRVQVQRTYVVDLERGRRNVTLRTIGRFAEALESPVAELFGRSDREPLT